MHGDVHAAAAVPYQSWESLTQGPTAGLGDDEQQHVLRPRALRARGRATPRLRRQRARRRAAHRRRQREPRRH